MSDPMVTLAEIAAAMGRKPADVEDEARELGLTIRPDWAGRAALSVDEARALASGDPGSGELAADALELVPLHRQYHEVLLEAHEAAVELGGSGRSCWPCCRWR